MLEQQIIEWLLEGDVSIQYQVWRDLPGYEKEDLQNSIPLKGWGLQYLSKRHPAGHWGDRFYQPKWISTHYTLLDLRNLSFPPNHELVRESILLVLDMDRAGDGGIQLGPGTKQYSDVCVNGMFLNYASYFRMPESKLQSIVDSLLLEVMPDGGFNCRTLRSGAKHSSFHSTISVLEGLTEFKKSGYTYRRDEISVAIASAVEFLLIHHLFLSDRSGKVINKDFLKFSYPCRWRYDILRALDCFRYAGIDRDNRMTEALTYLSDKRNSNGTWNMPAAYPGKVHFEMEQAGKPGRWNTLRAIRVLKYFEF